MSAPGFPPLAATDTAELLDLHRQLVEIPSVSNEEGPIADFVARWLERETGRIPQRRGHNVWLELSPPMPPSPSPGSHPPGGGRLLLNSHLDTVPPTAAWTRPPHILGVEPTPDQPDEERRYGLGSNDAKASVAAILYTARALARRAEVAPLPGSVIVALTAAEEIGGDGLATVLPDLGLLDAAIVGEPTGLAPCVAQRGMLILRCVARGRTAHVAYGAENFAENAIHKAARDICRLHGMHFPPHPRLGTTQAQVVTIQGGTTRNRVPDACEFFVDFRTTPDLDHDTLAATVAGELESESVVHSKRYLPKATAERHAIVRAAVAATGRQPIGSATVSDWAFLGDVPTVKIGPGDTHRSHTPDEYVLTREIIEAATVYPQLIAEWWRHWAETPKSP